MPATVDLVEVREPVAVGVEQRRVGAEPADTVELVAVAEQVKARLTEMRKRLPKGTRLILAQDRSIFVRQSLDEAQGELLRGGALAVLVLLIFLRSLRGAFVAAVTIPTTIIATYAFMLSMGFSLNMMTALALSISAMVVSVGFKPREFPGKSTQRPVSFSCKPTR